MRCELPASRRALVTGLGCIAPPDFARWVSDPQAAPPETAPEITGFETPAGVPAFGFEAPEFRIEEFLPNLKTYVDRTSALALAAAQLALRDAGLLDPKARAHEVGCAYGTMYGCLDSMELFWKKVKGGNPRFAPPLPFTHGYANSPSSLVCIEYALRGSAATFSGTRLAGLHGLLFACDQIATGSGETVLVGASESLSRALHAHLGATGALSPSGRLGLWQGANDGIVPGEAAVFLVLESASSAAARGRAPYGEIAGLGLAAAESSGTEAALLAAFARAADMAGLGEQALTLVAASPSEAVLDRAERRFWEQRGLPREAVLAPKLFAGECLSVAPLLGLLCAARLLNACERPNRPARAVVDASDSGGTVGMAVLQRAAT